MSIWSSIKSAASKVGSTISKAFTSGTGYNPFTASAFTSYGPTGTVGYTNAPASTTPDGRTSATTNYIAPKSYPSMSSGNAAFMASNPQYGYSGTPNPTSFSSGGSSSPMSSGYSGSYSPLSASSFMTTSALGPTYSAPIQTPVNMTVSGSGLAGSQPMGAVGAGLGSNQNVTAGDVYGNNAGLGQTDINGLFVDPNKDKQEEPKKDKTLEDYIKEQKALNDAAPEVNSESIRAQANQDANLAAAQQQKNNTQGAINAITAKMNADLLRLREIGSKEGVTETVYGGQQATITREATIKLLPLQAQLATDQGNLELAQKMSDDLFKYRYEDATKKADRWLQNAERGYENYTKAEQKKLDNVAKVYTDRKSVVSDLRNYIQATADDARKSGAQGAWNILSGIQLPDPTSTNFDAQIERIGQIITQQGANIPVKETAADIAANKDIFVEAEKSLSQYKKQGYTRAEVEAEWRGANAASGQSPEDVQMPLTIQRALDNLYGAAPEATPTENTSKWYNPLSWF